MSGSWRVEIRGPGEEDRLLASKEGVMDPLQKLIQEPIGSPYRAATQVEGSYGTQYDFGRFKVNFTIRVTCDQTMKMVEEAAEQVFCKVVEITEKDMGRLVQMAIAAEDSGK